MLIQNNLVRSGVWKFQFIRDGLFYVNLPNNKDTKHQNIPADRKYFAVNFLLAESDSTEVMVDLGMETLSNSIFTC